LSIKCPYIDRLKLREGNMNDKPHDVSKEALDALESGKELLVLNKSDIEYIFSFGK
jgi:hypothetical protein